VSSEYQRQKRSLKFAEHQPIALPIVSIAGETMPAQPQIALIRLAIIITSVLMWAFRGVSQDTVAVKSDLESEVIYSARDSIRFDLKEQKVFLYGDAMVQYEDIVLKAAHISYDFDDQVARSYGTTDSLGLPVGKPAFSQAGNEFDADTIKYSFGTKEGVIKMVRTEQMESYVMAEQSKRHADGEIHNKGGAFTTCDRPKPHYHFKVGKMMVIPDDKIIIGPAYMKVGKVPTPLAIPFGLFPNKNQGTAGILMPVWGESDALGFYLLNGGFYTPISEHMDLQLTGDIYSRGSWGARAFSRYRTRYRYSGSLDFSTNTRLNGDREFSDFSRTRTFFLRWNHQMDSKASLTDRFNASVNVGSSDNFSNTLNSSTYDYLSNTFQSNVAWTHNWPGKPYSLGVNLRHSQNTLNRTFDITIPSVNFNMARIFPFQLLNNDPVARKRFYDDIAFTYSTNFDNRLSTTEDQLSLNNWDNLRKDFNNGVRHNFNLTTAVRNKFFTVTPRFTMTDRWYFRTIEKRYDAVSDTLITDTIPGFERAGNWNTGINLTSKLYGMFQFRGNGLKAIRHVVTPTVGLSYQPDQGTQIEGPFGPNGAQGSYSPFDIGIYGKPPSGESGRLNFSIVQSLEAKTRDGKNSTVDEIAFKKIRLIEFFGVSTNYDWIKDSLNWSNVNFSARTTLLDRINVNYNSSFDPYSLDSDGTRTDQSEWKRNKRLLRMTNTNVAVGFNWKSAKYGQTGADLSGRDDDTVVGDDNPDKGARIDLRLPWRVNVNYSYDITKSTLPSVDDNVRQSILINGDVNVIRQIKLGVTSGYDLVNEEFTPSSLNLYWDLHCWEFNVNYIPNGFRQSISFRINVKASVLRDMKYEQRRPINNDGQFLF
jgi:hypothetical protein